MRRWLPLEPQIGQAARVATGAPANPTRLAVEYRETHDGNVWVSGVALLIDGEEALASLGSGGYIGLPPHDLFVQEALIEPSTEPREVLLYRCDCGETGCGAVVARCYRQGDEVVWDRFDSGNPPPVDLTAPRPAEDALTFAAEEYEAFVSRVSELASRHPNAR